VSYFHTSLSGDFKQLASPVLKEDPDAPQSAENVLPDPQALRNWNAM